MGTSSRSSSRRPSVKGSRVLKFSVLRFSVLEFSVLGIDDKLHDRLWTLSKRALAANTNYMKYLRRIIRDDDRPWENGEP
jgi:hypothetical protein